MVSIRVKGVNVPTARARMSLRWHARMKSWPANISKLIAGITLRVRYRLPLGFVLPATLLVAMPAHGQAGSTEDAAQQALDAANAAANESARAAQSVSAYWSDARWEVERGASSCSLNSRTDYLVIGAVDDPESRFPQLMVDYDRRREEVTLYVFAPGADSLAAGDERRIKIALVQKAPQNGEFFDQGFAVTALKLGDATFLRGVTKSTILEGFRKYDLVSFFTLDDIVVISIGLEGFIRALPHLQACALEQMRANPSDPFAR